VVVVIGMMGSGKTTVGKELARVLRRDHVDSDDLIAQKGGVPAAEQLRADAAAFRQLEADCIAETLSAGRPVVLSVGGGAPSTPAVAEQLATHDPVVWIRVPEDELFRRIMAHGNDRPMLDGDPRERLHQLLEIRTPTYESAATVVVDGVGIPEEVAQRIVGVLT
jgi:shikimate kinase